MSRKEKSMKNLVTAMIGQVIGLVISFIARIVFVRILGAEYLGLNGLFTNILTVLSLAELGVGEAITFSLYKPLASKDERKCQMLMQLYKKVYIIIGIMILILGVSITPLLNLLIKDIPNIPYINLIYILFVLNTSVSYFFSYKRNLIIADQNRYIATIYRYIFYFILNLAQIIYLMICKDYIGFLVLQVISTILENVFVSLKANKMYSFLNDKNFIPLDSYSKKEIIKNTKAMMMHKIGGVVVSSTDNILISTFVNLSAVGIYSNYYMIISALNTIFGQIFTSLTASVGNMFVTEKNEKELDIFNKVYFMNFWIYSFSTICLICLFNSFVELWVGADYLFPFEVVLILTINFYITGMRKSTITFKEAAGLFYNDRWKSVIEAIVNLIASIILVKIFDVFGVFLGTFISSVTVCVWVEPYVLYKYGFNKNFIEYFKKYFIYIIITILLGTGTFIICNNITCSLFLSFIIKLIMCLIIPNFGLFIIFRKTSEFNYFYTIIKGKVFRKKG